MVSHGNRYLGCSPRVPGQDEGHWMDAGGWEKTGALSFHCPGANPRLSALPTWQQGLDYMVSRYFSISGESFLDVVIRKAGQGVQTPGPTGTGALKAPARDNAPSAGPLGSGCTNTSRTARRSDSELNSFSPWPSPRTAGFPSLCPPIPGTGWSPLPPRSLLRGHLFLLQNPEAPSDTSQEGVGRCRGPA